MSKSSNLSKFVDLTSEITEPYIELEKKDHQKIIDNKFENWINAIQRVWDRYDQMDRN
ncbi:5296_t:CDS:2 [Gigaspora margarita]|uniref:5296_t:CDS:1 n=1 Tax=Gigaspora margarita TaxID=4874 RepID=A0ABN7V4X0_GIGMA|nr:5296_t:CDS:2 [Gigaspora margarita]